MATKFRVSSAILLVCTITLCSSSASTIPAVYLFGDSVFDVGTNDYLAASTVTASFPFYGIDSSSSLPIGRFSNGFNLADYLVQKMGFHRSPPPFLSLVAGGKCSKKFNQTITRGVNFASGGSGIFDSTGPTSSVSTSNLLAQAFFDGVTLASNKLGEFAPDAKVSLGNAFSISLDFITNGALFGIKELKVQCCGEGSGACNQTSTICGNRDEHLFWDGFHPTEFAIKLSAEVFLGNDPRYVSPFGFGQL